MSIHTSQLSTSNTRARARAAVLLGLAVTAGALTTYAFSDPGGKEWPMWGGTPDRNMVSAMKGAPTTWDLKTKKNI